MRQQRRSRQRSEPDEISAPPAVPSWLWETDDMQAALRSRHMGRVIRAYRQHPHHGYGGLSQEVVAAWAHMSQGQISRVESGRPPDNLERLIYWARLLRIPQRYLWFTLPEDTSDPEPSEPSPAEQMRDLGADTAPDSALPRESVTVRSDPVPAADQVDPGGIPMTAEEQASASTLPRPPIDINMHTAQIARMADVMMGGSAHFEVDREAVNYTTRAHPGAVENAQASANANKWFVGRIVRYMIDEAGLKQILFVSPTVPTAESAHALIPAGTRDAKIVFVIDNDTVMAHAYRFRAETSAGGAMAYTRGDLQDPSRFLSRAKRVLDFRRPMAIIMNASLHSIEDDGVAHRVVDQLVNAMASGSYLSITNLAPELHGETLSHVIRRRDELVKQSKMSPMTMRSREQMSRFFDGLELVEPGIVPLDQWHPDETTPLTNGARVLLYAAVGRKP